MPEIEHIEEANILGMRIKNHIDLHYTEDINLKNMAKKLNVNPYYMSHVFKGMSGFSPMQYVLRRRIGEAQNLLIETKWSISRIAALVGYDNCSHFISLFSKNVGMSPSKYRKNYLI